MPDEKIKLSKYNQVERPVKFRFIWRFWICFWKETLHLFFNENIVSGFFKFIKFTDDE